MNYLRATISTFLLLTLVAASSPVAMAQGNTAAKSKEPGEDRTLLAGDNWPIKITYFESTAGREAPVVILLPGAEGFEKSMTRKAWTSMAVALQKRGFAVVTADLRKHGDSADPSEKSPRLLPTDYERMAALDMEAIKKFLVEEHQKEKLNIRKLGIAAAGSSCMVASAFAAIDWSKKPWPDASVFSLRTPKGQDVRAILMLSPNGTVKGLNTNEIMRTVADRYKGIAVQIYFNPGERAEKSSAEKLYKFLEIKTAPSAKADAPAGEEGSDQSVGMDFSDARQLREGPTGKEFSGEGLLNFKDKTGKAPMEEYIGDFFDKYVKGREDTWKTRTSKLQ